MNDHKNKECFTFLLYSLKKENQYGPFTLLLLLLTKNHIYILLLYCFFTKIDDIKNNWYNY